MGGTVARPTSNDWNRIKIMKSNRLLVSLIIVGSAALITGCVERRVVYVPAPPGPPTYVYTPAPAAVAPAGTVAQAPGQATANLPPATASQSTAAAVAPTAPPAPQVEVVPAVPGPDYIWVPGYWGWNGRVWVWVGGRWSVRPWHGAVWVGGHWGRHGRGYVWVGGRWR